MRIKLFSLTFLIVFSIITTVQAKGSKGGRPPNVSGPVLSFADVFINDNNDVGVVIDASSEASRITKIDLFIDNDFIRTEGVSAYEWGLANTGANDLALQNLAPGSYRLRAVAIDDNGKNSEITQVLTIEEDELIVIEDENLEESGLPAGFTKCTNENGSCTFNQVVDVAYGANGKFNFKKGVTGTITFNNATFGDPIPRVFKAGFFKKSNLGPKLSFADVFTNEDNDVGVVIDATSEVSRIAKVDLFIDDGFVRTEKSAAFEWGLANPRAKDKALQNLAPGSYRLRAVATDKNGENSEITQLLIIEEDEPAVVEEEVVEQEVFDGDDGDACFFGNFNFGGSKTCFDEGVVIKSLSKLGLSGFSALQIKEGFQVTVCEKEDFINCTILTENISAFNQVRFENGGSLNDRINSLAVELKEQIVEEEVVEEEVVIADGDVCLFVDTNFSGQNICYNDGDIVNDLNGIGFSNVFSSVQIKNGVEAVLCDDKKLANCILLDSDVSNLGNVKFANGKSANDAITSLQIEAAAVAAITLNGGWFESAGQINTDLKNPQYLLQIESPAQVTIDLKSSIDTVLFLVDNQTNEVFKNDDGGIGTNSRISLFLIPGRYTLIAATAKKKEAGAFAISTDVGILDGKHVQFLNAPSQGGEDDYYKKVDPKNKRLTQSAWLKENQFNDRNIEEISVNYYNNADLGLGRELHCRELSGDRVSCTTSNYGAPGKDDSREALEDTIGRKNTLGQVNMEFDPSNLENTVSFYVYAPDGSRLNNLQLDNQHAKTVPGVCLNCHGGKYDEKTNSVKGGQFLAFDLETFRFGTGKDSESAQSEAFRKINAIVRKINPGSDIAEYIDGVYRGKVDEVGGLFDRNYVPPNWLAAGNSIDYTYVIKPYCRGCHIANGESFEQVPFINKSDNDDYICGFDPEAPTMPHAEMSDTAFWDDITAVILSVSDFMDCRKQRFGDSVNITKLQ